uniref:hypothetical protein n=1 Tax=Mycobacterium sp. HUMS_1102779 TaxID=3383487 RepID=UPI003899C7B0
MSVKTDGPRRIIDPTDGAVLRLFTQPRFDGGQPGADCLTPQLRTNSRLQQIMKATFSDPTLSSSICHM